MGIYRSCIDKYRASSVISISELWQVGKWDCLWTTIYQSLHLYYSPLSPLPLYTLITYLSSDHSPVLISINYIVEYLPKSTTLCYQKPNWYEFERHMENLHSYVSLKTPAEVEEVLFNFAKLYNSYFEFISFHQNKLNKNTHI